MNWDAVGAVGEVGGAIAVVVTLAYLAKQIRHSSLSTRAATTLDASRMLAEWMRGMHQTADSADLWARGMSAPDSLADQEVPRFLTIVAETLHVAEGMWRQSKLGLVDEDTLRPFLRMAALHLNNPIVSRWWESQVGVLSNEFREHMEGLRREYADSDYGPRVAAVRSQR